MVKGSRLSLGYFLLWSLVIVSLTAFASGSKKQTPMTSELVQEIESLDVIQEVNGGKLNSDQVALIQDSPEGVTEAASVAKTHRTPRRAVLSQR